MKDKAKSAIFIYLTFLDLPIIKNYKTIQTLPNNNSNWTNPYFTDIFKSLIDTKVIRNSPIDTCAYEY